MTKIIDFNKLETDTLLDFSRENDYSIIVIKDDNGDDVILDDDDLSNLLKDFGVVFIDNDDYVYMYQLNNIKFAVPYQSIECEDGNLDQYLNFNEKYICWLRLIKDNILSFI